MLECTFLIHRKTERKITFAQFEQAMKLLAEKKYPGDTGGTDKLISKITAGQGPQAHGTTVSIMPSVVMVMLLCYRKQ